MRRDCANRDIKLAVIIVNYRTPQLVLDCLGSLLPELAKIDATTVVVDNHSDDGSADIMESWIRENTWDANVHLLRSRTNGGFSAGNNLGISVVRARNYLLLNSDTLVRPGAVARLLATLEDSPSVGLLGPRLEYPDGSVQISCFRLHNCISEFLRGAQLSVFDRLFRQYCVAIDDEHSAKIHWISFACVVIRGDVLQQIGPLDENFFMYFEDAEFCMRARAAGWEIQREAAARVVHLRGGSSEVKRNTIAQQRLPSYFYRSRARYFRLRGGLAMLIAANLSWMVGRLLGWTKFVVGRGPRGPANEIRDLWQGMGPDFIQRGSGQ